jgi:Ni,Fe-hydrogenase III component G
MAELTDWKDEYARLRGHIAAHPEIVLTKNEISIPQPLRDEFYRIFDDIRRAVVAKHLDVLSVGARTLSERYIRIEKEVAGLLGVKEIGMPIDLRVFLHNPEEGLVRAVYNCLFALIQGKIDEAEFENLAKESIAASVAELFRLGYERWAGLEIIKLLEPEEAFFVGLDEDFKPYLRELEDVSFGKQWHHPTMRIPEFVIRSRRFNSLVAVKMALAMEIEEYVVTIKPPVRPKKRTGDTSFSMDSRVALLSFLESEKKIPVYADIYDGTRTSPDLLVEFINMNSAGGEEEVFERARRHIEILNPKFGCTLIAPIDNFQTDSEMIPENVRLVSLGFDTAKLETELAVLSA